MVHTQRPWIVASFAAVAFLFAAVVPASAQMQRVGDERPYFAESQHPYMKADPQGAAQRLPSLVWSDEVVSPGATFVRVHFSAFALAPGDFVVVSDREGTVSWKYTGKGPSGTGEFWSFAVPGDTARLAIHARRGGAHGYRIDTIAHGTQDIFAQEEPASASIGPKSICNTDGKEDVVCHADLSASYRPVARLLFSTGGGGQALCTGWLVKGSNANTMMTNNHCISTQAGVSSLQAMFNFQRTTCGGATDAATTSFAGGTFLRTSPVDGGLDYTLLTLQGNPRATFGELTASATNAPVGRQIYIMQHPGGRQKQVGFFTESNHATRCSIVSSSGTQTSYNCDTEGGSSGSAVFDATTGQVVALHHFGGCPTNSATAIVPICTHAGSLLSCGGGSSPNLALNKPATGSASCNVNEGPAKAVNGSVSGGNTDKWCSSAATKFLRVDLGASFNLTRFIVRHASAGGESAAFNSRDFSISTSTDGVNFMTAVNVTGSTAGVTTHNIASRTARFIRLNVTTPTQNGNAAARIYEFEAYAGTAAPVGAASTISELLAEPVPMSRQ